MYKVPVADDGSFIHYDSYGKFEWKDPITFESDLIFKGETKSGFELILVDGNEYIKAGEVIFMFSSDFAELVPLLTFGKATKVKLTYSKKTYIVGMNILSTIFGLRVVK